MYVYLKSEPGLFTVGFYDPAGDWHSESDCGSPEQAADRVAYLNGSGGRHRFGEPESELGYSNVLELHAKFGLPIGERPAMLTHELFGKRSTFMMEELVEFQEAHWERDLVKAADSLLDLVYVAKGTAVCMGLPWEALWRHVHAANMRKSVVGSGDGGHKFHLGKPPGWVSPNGAIRAELVKSGADGSLK